MPHVLGCACDRALCSALQVHPTLCKDKLSFSERLSCLMHVRSAFWEPGSSPLLRTSLLQLIWNGAWRQPTMLQLRNDT